MRLLIALLLCLAIPLQGWAAGAGVQAPCPMGDMVAMQVDAASEEMADLGACCNDEATAALTGKLCKTGQECQAPTGWLGTLSQPIIQAQPTSVLLVTGTPTPPRGSPASVWRPPTL
ncbi:MAG: hypothetical protein Q8K87_07770 [Hydrogenophaga sp.]|uniref:hypothetical protein n=1 Tax=Hydrogenophaga sp. TaxID=1904254 RepID=UPI0025B91334|nr:hypothetical protein [Hydrogenophaga sp.]MBU4184481.1 hypothetical protein [Gammaproteobacteria bacterium]MBU4280883.1 hypothetical protein [Gammaproteobacteria bacterium]MBU4325109.1 hypothetical protein [Gammaproteobacteria bacterium]MBU4505698.1 hypothetical protein [Gammaproteobacteria bacterium]MCG2658230.1 hypothetical protein [Hydrogenophaga sp.]